MYFELFSSRKKARLKAGQEDVFQYDDLPEQFRVQIIHLVNEAIGDWNPIHDCPQNEVWSDIFRVFVREKGTFRLNPAGGDHQNQCAFYIMTESTDNVLDLIELIFRWVDKLLRRNNDYSYIHGNMESHCGSVLEELNLRFRQHAIGYEYAGGEIIRIDSKFIHAEAVLPAIQLLHEAGEVFSSSVQEFMDAHRKYREGEYKDSINAACRSFESVMKAICTENNWDYDPMRATASKLIEIMFNKDLIPPYMKEQFTTLRGVLESGVPTARNKTSGHGQISPSLPLPDHFVAYVLHLTASNIVYLIECHKAIP